ncbi:MAG TPA: hypothetical protein PLI09_15680 [Candidatus Hydrogenedentes bacterium]|nr:hypothetical protein [Candidatus Hydrogenedentota bacterium]
MRSTLLKAALIVFLCVAVHEALAFSIAVAILFGFLLFCGSWLLVAASASLAVVYLLIFLLWPMAPPAHVFYPAGVTVMVLLLTWKKRLIVDAHTSYFKQIHSLFLLIGLISFLFLFIRTFPAAKAMMFGVLSFCLFWAYAPYSETPLSKRLKNGMVNGGVMAVSLLIVVAVGEIACRIIGPAPPPSTSMFQWDPRYIYISKPDSEVVFSVRISGNEYRPIKHIFSSQGLRDREFGPKKPDEYRILMLGDSFTQGQTVTPENTISGQLEETLRHVALPKKITVINAGLVMAGPLQELGMLETYGLKLQPDLVILQLFPTNDLENALVIENKVLRSYAPMVHNFLRILRQSQMLPYRIELWMNEHCYLYHAITYTLGRKGLIVDAFNQCRLYTPVPLEKLPGSEDRLFTLESDLREWYPELWEGMEIFKKDILEIDRVCQEKKIGFIAYCMPKGEDVCDATWRAAPHAELYERGKSFNLTQEFLDQKKIVSIPVADTLKNCCKPRPWYFHGNGHTNEEGNRRIAEKIAEFLVKRYFPEHPMTSN